MLISRTHRTFHSAFLPCHCGCRVHRRLESRCLPKEVQNRRDGLWDQLQESTRQLEAAIGQEDYGLAAKLRDERTAMLEGMSPMRQILFHQLTVLSQPNASFADKLRAVNTLRDSFDEAAVPALAPLLGHIDKTLSDAASEAMWAVFMHSRDGKVQELMNQGLRFLSINQLELALDVFERVINLAPDFSEGYNKRATVLYLLGRWSESIDDCETVLEMQPFHFGAAAGLALCHVQLQQYDEALRAFDVALKIHPGMESVARHARDIRALQQKLLRQKQEQQQQQNGQ